MVSSGLHDMPSGPTPSLTQHSFLTGGSTYCALAAMSLCGRLESLTDAEALVAWLTSRQRNDGEGGFNGRVDKPDDACYSFWCGASLSVRIEMSGNGSGRAQLYGDTSR